MSIVSGTEIGLVLALGAAFSKAVQSVFMKTNAVESDEYVTAWASRFFALPVLLIAIYILGIPELGTLFPIYLLLTSLLLTAASIFLAKAHKISDISLIMPIMAFSPALLLITSPLMVGQIPSKEGIFGVLIVTVGAYYLKSGDANGLLSPFRKLSEDRGVQFIFLVVVIYSITSNFDKLAVDVSSPVFWALSVNFTTAVFLTPIMAKKSDWKEDILAFKDKLFFLGSLGGLTVIMQFTALNFTLVPYVISIKRLSIPISVILGIIIFKEKEGKRRLLGSLVMLVGAVIIFLAL